MKIRIGMKGLEGGDGIEETTSDERVSGVGLPRVDRGQKVETGDAFTLVAGTVEPATPVWAGTPRRRAGKGSPEHELRSRKNGACGFPSLEEAALAAQRTTTPSLGVSTVFERLQDGTAALDHELSSLQFAQDQHLTYERDYHDPEIIADREASDAIVARRTADDLLYYQIDSDRRADADYIDRRISDDYYDRNRRR